MKYKKIRTSEIIPNMWTSIKNVINNIDHLINTYDTVYMYYADTIHQLYLATPVGKNNIMFNCDMRNKNDGKKARICFYNKFDLVKKGALFVVR